MKQFLKDTLILILITLVAGALLGFVNELTKEPIARYEVEKKALACGEVFFEEDETGELCPVKDLTFEPVDSSKLDAVNTSLVGKIAEDVVIDEIYCAYEQDVFYGYVIGVTSKKGYNGEISFYIGITEIGQLKGVSLLQIAETPGLGMNAERVLLPQFRDVKAGIFTVVKTGAVSETEIDAISGATVTTQAITDGVNAAYECYCILQEGGETL